MQLTIDFQDIMERCQMESAFIGRTAEHQDNDKVRSSTSDNFYSCHYVGPFDIVRIRGGDEPLIMTFIREGAHLLESKWHWAMTASGQYTTATVVWKFKGNISAITPVGSTSSDYLTGVVSDLLTAYALSRWLHDKLPDLATHYLLHYENTSLSFSKTLSSNTLKTPRKRFK